MLVLIDHHCPGRRYIIEIDTVGVLMQCQYTRNDTGLHCNGIFHFIGRTVVFVCNIQPDGIRSSTRRRSYLHI